MAVIFLKTGKRKAAKAKCAKNIRSLLSNHATIHIYIKCFIKGKMLYQREHKPECNALLEGTEHSENEEQKGNSSSEKET